MSSSATSANSSDASASALSSRGEKRPASPVPGDQPQLKKSRIDQSNNNHWNSTTTTTTETKLQLPSILTSFNDSFRPDRRASLPNLSDKSASRRHTPYPPTGIRVNYAPNNQSSLSNYQFPPSSPDDSSSSLLGSAHITTASGSYGEQPSPYSALPPLTNGTTPSTSTFSPASPEYNNAHHPSLTVITDNNNNNNWQTSPSGIVRPNSTGQLTSSSIKYDDSLRHSSFSAAPVSQPHLYAGSARISGQKGGMKNEWSFPNNPEFLLPSTPSCYPSPPTGSSTSTSVAAVPVPERSPRAASQTVPSSNLVDRPQRKRGKLPKETTDFLKAWLHKHSDHPYPSEEEKKQLCHATGLSMSQVSNWMINVSRLLLLAVIGSI